MRRALGIVAALAIVGAGLAVRVARDSGDDGPVTPDAVVCARDLVALCAGVDGATVETPQATFDRLTEREAESVIWVTADPWPAMVDDERQRNGLAPLFEQQLVVASTEIVFVGWEDRLTAVEQSCGLSWECALSEDRWVDLGGEGSWQRVSVAIVDPGRASTAIASLAWVSGVSDGTALRDAPLVLSTLVQRQRQATADPLGSMLLTGAAGIDLMPAPAAEAATRIALSQNQVPVIRRAAGPTVALVVAGVAGVDSGDEARSVEAAALAGGWDTAEELGGISGGQGVALWLAYEEVR